LFFKAVFRLEIHQNNVFFYFFKLFFISVHQNDKKKHEKINFKQKNKKLPNLYLKRNTKHELRVVTSVDLR